MESAIKVFENSEFGNIRTVSEDSTVLFCGKDIAEALGYSNTRDAIARHCRGVVKRDGVSVTKNQYGTETQQIVEMSFISEGDVYRLVCGSTLPAAEKFERWVFDEVLPSIRRDGGYIAASEDDDEDAILTRALLIAQRKIEELKNGVKAAAPKVLFADAVSSSHTDILIGDLAKLLKQNGIDLGQKRLFDWLRDHGYLMKGGSSKNMPTQRAIDMGLFRVKETVIQKPDDSSIVKRTTKVTGKGQIYFVNKFLGDRRVA